MEALPPVGCSCKKKKPHLVLLPIWDSCPPGLLVYLLLLLLLLHCRKPEACALVDTLEAWELEYLHPDSAAAGPEPLSTILPKLLSLLPGNPGSDSLPATTLMTPEAKRTKS